MRPLDHGHIEDTKNQALAFTSDFKNLGRRLLSNRQEAIVYDTRANDRKGWIVALVVKLRLWDILTINQEEHLL